MIVVGDERRVRRGAQGREFPIVRIRDDGERVRIERPSKFFLGPEKIGDRMPIEAGDPP
jgi:hypothetical protein